MRPLPERYRGHSTANQIGALASAEMTAAIFVGAIGAEMLYLAQIQMRLVLDLPLFMISKLIQKTPKM